MAALTRRASRPRLVTTMSGIRTVALGFASMITVAVSLGQMSACSEDTVEVPDELRGEPYCALIIGTYGHYDDDRRWLIVNYATEFVAVGCVCATPEDIESGARDDELNDAALAECEEQSATMDFAWDECQADHASREWLDVIISERSGDAHLIPPDLRCIGG